MSHQLSAPRVVNSSVITGVRTVLLVISLVPTASPGTRHQSSPHQPSVISHHHGTGPIISHQPSVISHRSGLTRFCRRPHHSSVSIHQPQPPAISHQPWATSHRPPAITTGHCTSAITTDNCPSTISHICHLTSARDEGLDSDLETETSGSSVIGHQPTAIISSQHGRDEELATGC